MTHVTVTLELVTALCVIKLAHSVTVNPLLMGLDVKGLYNTICILIIYLLFTYVFKYGFVEL